MAAVVSTGARATEMMQIGIIVAQRGTATAIRDDRPTELWVGAPVYETDRLSTGPEARLEVELADGSVLTIGDETEVHITEYRLSNDNSRLGALVNLVSGIVRATVARAGETARFDIATSTSIASARSTSWLVHADADASAVFVTEGTVAVTGPKAGNEILLTSGFGTDIDKQGLQPGKRWGIKRINAAMDRLRP